MKNKYILVLVIFIIALIAFSSFFLHENLDIIINKILIDLLRTLPIITLLLLGFLAIFDLLDRYGIKIDFYSKKKDIEIKKRVEEAISVFCKEEYEFLRQLSKARIDYFVLQLGLTQDQFDEIKYTIIKLRQMPVRTIEQVKDFMWNLCVSNESETTGVLIDSDKMLPDNFVYKKVKYYINLSDICYEETIRMQLAKCLQRLIFDNLEEDDMEKINFIVIPDKSNMLLGIEAGKLLKKPIIKILESPRMKVEQFWDGKFHENSNIIVIHDVLVTGEQVERSIDRLKKINKNYGIFCLVNRMEYKGKEKLEKLDIKTYSVLELSDKIIEERIKNNN